MRTPKKLHGHVVRWGGQAFGGRAGRAGHMGVAEMFAALKAGKALRSRERLRMRAALGRKRRINMRHHRVERFG